MSFADTVAETLRIPAYDEYAQNGLKDGPSWWVMVKYPFACAKCGRLPCHCLIEPWILENRREDPGPYLARFRKEADQACRVLGAKKLEAFSIKSLIEHFRAIYRASYYHQEAWKIGMHLSEEIGEATIELGRMEIVSRARDSFDLTKALNSVFEITRNELDSETAKIRDSANRNKRQEQLKAELRFLEGKLKEGDSWKALAVLIGERFKEEIADILSWLSAIIVKLDPNLEELAKYPKKFIKEKAGGVKVLQCPWCRNEVCSDRCLVLHGVSGEIREKVSKF